MAADKGTTLPATDKEPCEDRMQHRREALQERLCDQGRPSEWWLDGAVRARFEELVGILKTRQQAGDGLARAFAIKALEIAFSHRARTSRDELNLDPRRNTSKTTIDVLRTLGARFKSDGTPRAPYRYIYTVAMAWEEAFGTLPGAKDDGETPFMEVCRVAFNAAYPTERGFGRDTIRGTKERILALQQRCERLTRTVSG